MSQSMGDFATSKPYTVSKGVNGVKLSFKIIFNIMWGLSTHKEYFSKTSLTSEAPLPDFPSLFFPQPWTVRLVRLVGWIEGFGRHIAEMRAENLSSTSRMMTAISK